jgi:hypothetical protein
MLATGEKKSDRSYQSISKLQFNPAPPSNLDSGFKSPMNSMTEATIPVMKQSEIDYEPSPILAKDTQGGYQDTPINSVLYDESGIDFFNKADTPARSHKNLDPSSSPAKDNQR